MATTYVGKPQPWIEGLTKVTGETLYAADLQLPRILPASAQPILKSPESWIVPEGTREEKGL